MPPVQLTAMASDVTRRQKDWPTKPSALWENLSESRRLRKVGIEIVFHPRNNNRRLITIRGATPTAQPADLPTRKTFLPNDDAFALAKDEGDDGDDPRDDPETIVTHIVTPAVNPQGVDRHDEKRRKWALVTMVTMVTMISLPLRSLRDAHRRATSVFVPSLARAASLLAPPPFGRLRQQRVKIVTIVTF